MSVAPRWRLLAALVLSRDSWLGQRMLGADFVQIGDGGVDCGFEIVEVGEGAMGEMMSLEIAPRTFDVIELRSILGQPLNREPMPARVEGCPTDLAGVDRAVVEHQHHRLGRLTRLGAVEA